MKKSALLSILVALVVGCSTTSIGPDDDVPDLNLPMELQGTISMDSVLRNVEPDSSQPDYRVTGDLSFAAVVTIQPGVVVHVDAGKAITVTAAGAIVSVGADSQPIVIRGSQQSSGFWKGIRILSNSPTNEIAYARVEDGGGGSFTGLGVKANVTLGSGARLKLRHAHVVGSGGHGIYLEAVSSRLDGFEENIVTGNAMSPVYCRMQHFQHFDTTSSYTGNGDDRITGYYTGVDAEVTGSHVWQPVNVPFTFEGVDQSIAGQVTLLAGVRLLAEQDAGLIVEQGASLAALGTDAQPVEIKGEENVAGYWRGINVLSNSTANRLEHVDLANGGSAGFDGNGYRTNLILGANARMVLHRSTIRSSAGWGIFVEGEGASLPEFWSNTIADNALAPIRLRADQFKYLDTSSLFSRNGKNWIEQHYRFNIRTVVGDHIWKALSVPYYLTGQDLELEGDGGLDSLDPKLGQGAIWPAG